jgi:hypothetical protein
MLVDRRARPTTRERWFEIYEFPTYSISDHGRVRNDFTGRIMALTRNQSGVVYVGLVRDGRQHKRSVAKMVANTFLPKNTLDHYTTPIHLDGDPSNCHYKNLMWRPRAFADAYHRQFNRWPLIGRPIVDVDTGERFHDSMVACVKYGLLDRDVAQSVINGTEVRPTYQTFALAQ